MPLQDENGHEPAVGSAKYFVLLEARLVAVEQALKQLIPQQEAPVLPEDATDAALPAQRGRYQRG